jgi:uncharacterized membrane protein YczE
MRIKIMTIIIVLMIASIVGDFFLFFTPAKYWYVSYVPALIAVVVSNGPVSRWVQKNTPK